MIGIRNIGLLLATLPAWAVVSGVCAAAKPKKKNLPEVLVVADARGAPETLRPSPGKPVHCLIVGGVEKHLGEDVPGVKSPDAAAVRRELVKALATQGFLEAKDGGPMPQIALLYSWGTANLMWNDPNELETGVPTGTSAGEDPGSSAPPGFGMADPGAAGSDMIYYNAREIRELIGADKASQRLLSWWDADRINEAFRNDRIYITVLAYDLAAVKQKQKRLLWRTRISVDWRDHKDDTLSVMLASAAPYFGRANDMPIFVDDNLRKKAEVTIGETRVIEEDAKPEAEK